MKNENVEKLVNAAMERDGKTFRKTLIQELKKKVMKRISNMKEE